MAVGPGGGVREEEIEEAVVVHVQENRVSTSTVRVGDAVFGRLPDKPVIRTLQPQLVSLHPPSTIGAESAERIRQTVMVDVSECAVMAVSLGERSPSAL